MPLPVAESVPQWLTNVIIAAGGIATIVTGFVIKRVETRREAREETPRIVGIAGTLGDGRQVERLVDELSELGRTARDVEREVRSLCRTVERSTAEVAEARADWAARNRAQASETERFVAALETTRGKKAE